MKHIWSNPTRWTHFWKIFFQILNWLLTCYSMYPQKWSMQSCDWQSLVLNFLEHFQFPHCCRHFAHCRGHSPTVEDISTTVADITTVADTFTLVSILVYMIWIKVFWYTKLLHDVYLAYNRLWYMNQEYLYNNVIMWPPLLQTWP